jgi:hypothetical protein
MLAIPGKCVSKLASGMWVCRHMQLGEEVCVALQAVQIEGRIEDQR